ncbi:YD repeat protein [Rhodobacteraceae bacterium KLH11]|nr:YD repeat protein [Rhodobacteraceae bacterium KLH11]
MEPSALHQAEFFQPQEVSVVEETSVHFAARAPPIVGADIVVTGAAVAEHGNGIIVHGHETHAASLGFGVGFDATNRTLPNGSPYSQADYDAYVRRKSDAGETPRSLEDYVQRRQQLDQNRADGTRRQEQYRQEMADIYGEENVLTERYLRDADGDIVRDPQTGEARRLDCVVVNGQCGTFTSEVTSPTANKVDQIAKEERIREQGGTFVENPNTGELIEVPISNIERME